MYTLPGCVHCARARALLRRRGIEFTERTGAGDPDFRGRLARLTGGATVPQIVIGGEPIGGADRLAWLDRRGVLLALARGEEFPWATAVSRISLPGLLRWPAALLGGGACGPWRHEVVRIDRAGTTLERVRVPSARAGAELAELLNAGQAGSLRDVDGAA